MTRYLIFFIFNLIIGFFVLISTPYNSLYTDIIGLITLSIGTGIYLKNNRAAGLICSIGLSMLIHILNAWWDNYISFDYEGDYGMQILLFYIVLTIAFVVLFVFSIRSVFNDKGFNNKLDNIKFAPAVVNVLSFIPVVIVIIEIVICLIFLG